MELYRNKLSIPFFILSLALLMIGLTFGFIGSVQYLVPDFLKEWISFDKVRPLHVSSVVFWILVTAMGSVITFLQEHIGGSIKYPPLLKAQFWVFAITFLLIIISYFLGIFGGREYWEFHPYFAFPIAFGWLLFIINVFSSIKNFRNQPVYVWMWLTGLVFFLFTYIESNLWQILWFRKEIIHDMTIQWKSYGSLVGSWNMLIYGSSIYLMDKISGNQKYSYSSIAFALYFLGLLNGMFNWGHHIYTLPTHHFVKHIAYIISMTELILIARIIYLWKDSLTTAKMHKHLRSYQFIIAADVWVFITLILAILMSIPALNVYMHGTHVVVAHTMGATIGINTMLLFAYIFDVIKDSTINEKIFKIGYRIIQISLPIFFLSLLSAGIYKGFWQMQEQHLIYGSMLKKLKPAFLLFSSSGFFLVLGFFMIIFIALKSLLFIYSSKNKI
ncbi:MAG: cbb3-type cytochrome c oxidase subunit I [Chitinophagaceae bacterium]|nr:MAG: nitric-oxide reductase (NorBC) subunit B [Bacteroidetes bacterium OLB11]MCC6448374.1 cbb3-type cytochrome c oxidase subunit I [Chitinophagaceae bacterium]HMN33482.1 cbb3-type cytochrome c oxidase subunit I [Chitinophagaceae bacterium]